MSWKTLLAARKIHTHHSSKQELDELRAVVKRDLADAALPALSEDRRFATAYNAALQVARMATACAGYRVAAVSGHRFMTRPLADERPGRAGLIQKRYYLLLPRS
jgi:hypothetical protein